MWMRQAETAAPRSPIAWLTKASSFCSSMVMVAPSLLRTCRRSALGEGVGALELDDHGRIVAQNPGVVAGGDLVHHPGGDVAGRPVVVPDADASPHDVADVLHLAGGG